MFNPTVDGSANYTAACTANMWSAKRAMWNICTHPLSWPTIRLAPAGSRIAACSGGSDDDYSYWQVRYVKSFATDLNSKDWSQFISNAFRHVVVNWNCSSGLSCCDSVVVIKGFRCCTAKLQAASSVVRCMVVPQHRFFEVPAKKRRTEEWYFDSRRMDMRSLSIDLQVTNIQGVGEDLTPTQGNVNSVFQYDHGFAPWIFNKGWDFRMFV